MTLRVDAIERRDQIMAVALTEFSRTGFHETSMSQIAESVGVTKPVLYQHFIGKRALYLELLEALGHDLITQIRRATNEISDGRLQTERGMVTYFDWVVDNREAFILLFTGSARNDAEFADAIRHIERQAADAIAPLIIVNLSEAERRTMAFGLVGMAEAVSRHLIAQGTQIDPEKLGTQLAGLAWAGLRSLGHHHD